MLAGRLAGSWLDWGFQLGANVCLVGLYNAAVLTAERSMEIQRQLGADIVLVFDECTPFKVAKSYTAASMPLWGRRDDWARGPLLVGRQTIAAYL